MGWASELQAPKALVSHRWVKTQGEREEGDTLELRPQLDFEAWHQMNDKTWVYY